MPTRNPRINITFEPATSGVLAYLAIQEEKSVTSVAKELVLEALERREDMALSTLAEIREQTIIKRVKHRDAWK